MSAPLHSGQNVAELRGAVRLLIAALRLAEVDAVPEDEFVTLVGAAIEAARRALGDPQAVADLEDVSADLRAWLDRHAPPQ